MELIDSCGNKKINDLDGNSSPINSESRKSCLSEIDEVSSDDLNCSREQKFISPNSLSRKFSISDHVEKFQEEARSINGSILGDNFSQDGSINMLRSDSSRSQSCELLGNFPGLNPVKTSS